MSEPVKVKVKVTASKYVEEADSILLIGRCKKGEFYQQIHSSAFDFGGKDKKTEMIKTAEMLIGKSINFVSDTDLEDKIKDHFPLKYK